MSTRLYTPRFLTGTSVSRAMGRYIAAQLFPIRTTQRQAGFLAEIDKADTMLRMVDYSMNPGTTAPKVAVELSRDNTFYCQKYGVSYPVTDEMVANADEEARELVTNGGAWTVEILKRHREKQFVDFLAAAFTGNQTSSPSTKWNNSNGTPIPDIRGKAREISSEYGVRPNALGLDVSTLDAIMENDDTKDRIIQTLPPGQQANGIEQQAQILATLLGFDSVFVAEGAVINTAAEGQTKSLSTIWGENVFMCRVEPIRIGTQATGCHVAWNGTTTGGIIEGFRVKEVRHEDTDSTDVEARAYYDQLGLQTEGGHLFTNTLE